MRIKVFTATSSDGLQITVNRWLIEQGQMITVISTHFSTNATRSNMNDPIETEYHAAIYYIDLL